MHISPISQPFNSQPDLTPGLSGVNLHSLGFHRSGCSFCTYLPVSFTDSVSFVFRHHSRPNTTTSTYPSCPWPFHSSSVLVFILQIACLPASRLWTTAGRPVLPLHRIARSTRHFIFSLIRTCLCFDHLASNPYRTVDVPILIIFPYGLSR